MQQLVKLSQRILVQLKLLLALQIGTLILQIDQTRGLVRLLDGTARGLLVSSLPWTSWIGRLLLL